MWIGRTEYVNLCERLARLEAAEEARRGGAQHDAAQREVQQATAPDVRRLAAQFENLLAYDGTVQTGGERDAEE